MVSKIRMSQKRVRTAEYIGRLTNRGYRGRVVREGGRSSLAKEVVQPALQPPPKIGNSKRPRLDRYSPDLAIPAAPLSPAQSSSDEGEPPMINPPLGGTEEEPPYRPVLLEQPEEVEKRKGKNNQEYIREWEKTKVTQYLGRIIQGEGIVTATCLLCSAENSCWRCMDCIGRPRLCSDCCRISHRSNPFHRVECWSGSHWVPAWLWQVGTIVCLGHGSQPCPKYEASLEGLERRLISVNSTVDFSDDNDYGATPQSSHIGCGELVSYVHTNGIHHLPTYPCWCPKAEPDDIQFMDRELYPASWKKVSTVFTFEVLKLFHLLKVHAHMSTELFYELLRRQTNSTFPSKVPDRRRELARVWVEWNYLINLKQNGFAHVRPGEQPGRGDFATLCPCCPTPEINLPKDWKKDRHQSVMQSSIPVDLNLRPSIHQFRWLYRRYLAGDGNFVLDHLADKGRDPGMSLTRGASYFAEPVRYEKHVKSTRELHEPPTCNKLRAVSEKNVYKKGYDATGVVAIACARHGFFVPGSMVDLQKGERQLNVDYALCQALKSTKAHKTPGVVFAYDVNCQYSVNFHRRVEKGKYLRYDPSLPLDFVIGLFHVHGHKDECLSRFAPTYFPGAGVTSGEILESLWSNLNGAAKITRNMLKFGRWEMINACAEDSNIRKLQSQASALVKQRDLARIEVQKACDDFNGLNQSVSLRNRARWKAQMDEANRKRRSDPHAMDVYNTSVPDVVTKEAVQASLMESERLGSSVRGVAEWLGDAIELQEAQISFRGLLFASKDASSATKIDLERKSADLSKRIRGLYEQAVQLFSGYDLEAEQACQWDDDSVEICVCETECSCEELAQLPWGRHVPDFSSHPELDPIPLPSSFDILPEGWQPYRNQEEKLRVAQAEEALEALRGHIAHKSFLYRTNKTWSTGKRGRTRAYDEINNVEAAMRMQIKYYESAVWALGRLGLASKYTRFQSISRADTRAVTSVFDPNRRGERNEGLSWIWQVPIEGVDGKGATNQEKEGYLQELYRVNWIRARSRRDRWIEEIHYVKAEMGWYVRYMEHFESRARKWAALGLGDGIPPMRIGKRTHGGVSGWKERTCFMDNLPTGMSDPTLSPTVFVAARQLDPPSWQSVINYFSSRLRASATTMVLQSGGFEPDAIRLYTSMLRTELTSANVLLGLAVSFHGDKIHVPYTFKTATRLMVHERLEDFPTMKAMVEDKRDSDDTILARYAGNWWLPFDASIPLERRRLKPGDLLEFWLSQRKSLPPLRAPIPPPLLLNTGILSSQELKVAWTIAKDALTMLDEDIEESKVELADLIINIAKQEALRNDIKIRLQKAEAEAVKVALGTLNPEDSHAGPSSKFE
ncbi:hypothetical protein NMY22_g8207 [Coprinellus aureogranulatus]|nr:hypothetical protein NMY22_g8207 [Coprinellus aureogranulatus]